jgi:N-acetylglutamate synthase-like GNAT family acetyltransferase
MIIRHVEESDYNNIIIVLDEWWEGRRMADMLPRLFFKYFKDSSFVIEEENAIVAFLIGFISQVNPNHAYVHFMGIHPEYRKRGFGRQLYRVFFDTISLRDCDTVHLVTSPINKNSIAFHTRIGFQIEEGDDVVEGVSIHRDYDGLGEDRVLFVKRI